MTNGSLEENGAETAGGLLVQDGLDAMEAEESVRMQSFVDNGAVMPWSLVSLAAAGKPHPDAKESLSCWGLYYSILILPKDADKAMGR